MAARLKELVDAGPCEFPFVVPITQTSGSDHAVVGADGGARRARGWTAAGGGAAAATSWRDCAARGLGAGRGHRRRAHHHIRELARRESFDAVLVSTLPHRLSRWLRLDLPRRIHRASELLTEHVVSSAGPSL